MPLMDASTETSLRLVLQETSDGLKFDRALRSCCCFNVTTKRSGTWSNDTNNKCGSCIKRIMPSMPCLKPESLRSLKLETGWLVAVQKKKKNTRKNLSIPRFSFINAIKQPFCALVVVRSFLPASDNHHHSSRHYCLFQLRTAALHESMIMRRTHRLLEIHHPSDQVCNLACDADQSCD